jgi:hypothetical protein
MFNNLPIHFLRRKIIELETALFFPITQDLLRLPARIIRAIHVDKFGQVWYLVPMPRQFIQEFRQEFPGRLEFFRKEQSFCLRISGRTRLVTDPEEIEMIEFIPRYLLHQAMRGEALLVNMKIQQAEYQVFKEFHPGMLKKSWDKVIDFLQTHLVPIPNFHISVYRG